MIWARLAATGNFLLAAWSIFFAYGLFLGDARQFLPALSTGQQDFLMVGLTVYAVALVVLGGLLLRGYPVAGPLSAVMHLVTIGGTFLLIDVTQGNEFTRQAPRFVVQLLFIALDVKAMFSLMAGRRLSAAR